MNNKYRWFIYVDEKPDLKEAKRSLQVPNNLPVTDKDEDVSRVTAKQAVRALIPSFSVSGRQSIGSLEVAVVTRKIVQLNTL